MSVFDSILKIFPWHDAEPPKPENLVYHKGNWAVIDIGKAGGRYGIAYYNEDEKYWDIIAYTSAMDEKALTEAKKIIDK